MFNLTKQEILVLSFIGIAAVIGIGVDFYSKHIYSLETKIHFKVNINEAAEEELLKLDGIGPALAKRIIKFRNGYGPFEKIEDIKRIYGIGDKKFEQIKDFLTVD
ncbi:MAG: helix-hairpin-helix domain-containing protein [Candidatus Omnitrophota bacterium]